MGKVKMVMLTTILALGLLGCHKQDVSVSGTPIDGREIVLDANDGKTRDVIYRDENGTLYEYNFETKSNVAVKLKKDFDKALKVEHIEYKGEVSDDLTPIGLSSKNVQVRPHVYKMSTDTTAGEYLGYLEKAGYSKYQEYSCSEYDDLTYSKFGKYIRVIITKENIITFLESEKRDDTSATYINEKRG